MYAFNRDEIKAFKDLVRVLMFVTFIPRGNIVSIWFIVYSSVGTLIDSKFTFDLLLHIILAVIV